MTERIVRVVLRYAASVIIAAGLGTLVMVAYPIGSELTRGYGEFTVANAIGIVVSGWLLSLPFVAAGIVVIGVPIDLLLRRLGFGHLAAYALFGTLAGFGLALILSRGWIGSGLIEIAFSTYGLIAASTYWYFFPRRAQA